MWHLGLFSGHPLGTLEQKIQGLFWAQQKKSCSQHKIKYKQGIEFTVEPKRILIGCFNYGITLEK